MQYFFFGDIFSLLDIEYFATLGDSLHRDITHYVARSIWYSFFSWNNIFRSYEMFWNYQIIKNRIFFVILENEEVGICTTIQSFNHCFV